MLESELNRVNRKDAPLPASAPPQNGAAPYDVGPHMLLGDDPEPKHNSHHSVISPRNMTRILWSLGLAFSVVPLALWLHRAQFPWIVSTVLWMSAVVVAAHLGDLLTRRRVNQWVTRLSRQLGQNSSSFSTTHGKDVSIALQELLTELQHNLNSRLNGERNAFISTITGLASALEARDVYTKNHSARVANLSVQIGKQMGLSHQELYEVHLAGILHDIGKIGIRDEILLKPEGLTKAEYETMKTHPVVGARILSGIPGMEGVAEIVLRHHEMFDGRGYPDGVMGENIPLGARIVAAADTYMSMIEDRSYRPGRDISKAVKELERVAGAQLDPEVVSVLSEHVLRTLQTNPGTRRQKRAA